MFRARLELFASVCLPRDNSVWESSRAEAYNKCIEIVHACIASKGDYIVLKYVDENEFFLSV